MNEDLDRKTYDARVAAIKAFNATYGIEGCSESAWRQIREAEDAIVAARHRLDELRDAAIKRNPLVQKFEEAVRGLVA